MAGYIDFKELRARVPILHVAEWLGLKLKAHKDELRGSCPFCNGGGERGFVINSAKGLWNSFCGCCKGGDCISLVAKARDCGMREAAELIIERFGNSNSGTSRNSGTVRKERAIDTGSQPLDLLEPLKGLATDHEVIQLLGLSEAVCEAVGIGHCAKGLMKDRIVFPIRLPQGTLIGYIGLATWPDQEPLLKFPSNLDEKVAGSPAPAEVPTKPSDMRQLLRW